MDEYMQREGKESIFQILTILCLFNFLNKCLEVGTMMSTEQIRILKVRGIKGHFQGHGVN